MAPWSMNEISTLDGFTWEWDGGVQHNDFSANMPAELSMSYEVFVGDDVGDPLPGFAPAPTTLMFVAVPEPTGNGLTLPMVFTGRVVGRRRRRSGYVAVSTWCC